MKNSVFSSQDITSNINQPIQRNLFSRFSLRDYVAFQYLLLFGVLSGLLIFFGWSVNGVFPLLFIGFVPILIALSNLILHKRRGYLKGLMLLSSTYFTWIALTLLWLQKISIATYLFAVFFDGINYIIPLSFFVVIHRRAGIKWALVYFVCVIMVADYISQYSLLTTPYFIFGLGLGKYPALIQHYQIIGVEGGTLWLLIINCLFYYLLINRTRSWKSYIPLAILVILIPLFSALTFLVPSQADEASKILVQHTNVGSKEQVEYQDSPKLVDYIFSKSNNNKFKHADLLIWPESIIHQAGWLHKIDGELPILQMKTHLSQFTNLSFIGGILAYSSIVGELEKSKYTDYNKDGDYHYQTHNIAINLSSTSRTSFTSKELFIPFQERVPMLDELPFLENIMPSVGRPIKYNEYSNDDTFATDSKGNRFASAICYESLFPLFMSKRASDEVGGIIVLANEAWLKDLSCAYQCLYANCAMAIQCGKPIIRSSNQGISAVIDGKGRVLNIAIGKIFSTMESDVDLSFSATFYSHISGFFYFLSFATIALIILKLIMSKNKIKQL